MLCLAGFSDLERCKQLLSDSFFEIFPTTTVTNRPLWTIQYLFHVTVRAEAEDRFTCVGVDKVGRSAGILFIFGMTLLSVSPGY